MNRTFWTSAGLSPRSSFPDSLWTLANFQELTERFVNNVDEGADGFEVKLQRQLDPGSPDAKRLMAEILWVMNLFPSNAGADCEFCSTATATLSAGYHARNDVKLQKSPPWNTST